MSTFIPEVLFDGFLVMQAMDSNARARTNIENVSDVLDAVVRLMRCDSEIAKNEASANHQAIHVVNTKILAEKIVLLEQQKTELMVALKILRPRLAPGFTYTDYIGQQIILMVDNALSRAKVGIDNADEISQKCAASSIAADAAIARNEETIKRLRAMQPLIKDMGDALVLAKSLAAMLLEIKRANPDSANIEEAEDMACSIVIDLAGEIRNRDRDPIEPNLPTSPFDGMSHLRATGRGV